MYSDFSECDSFHQKTIGAFGLLFTSGVDGGWLGLQLQKPIDTTSEVVGNLQAQTIRRMYLMHSKRISPGMYQIDVLTWERSFHGF